MQCGTRSRYGMTWGSLKRPGRLPCGSFTCRFLCAGSTLRAHTRFGVYVASVFRYASVQDRWKSVVLILGNIQCRVPKTGQP
eukprot:2090458-Rhodomonas_salina.1